MTDIEEILAAHAEGDHDKILELERKLVEEESIKQKTATPRSEGVPDEPPNY